jgi:hypothetical protein
MAAFELNCKTIIRSRVLFFDSCRKIFGECPGIFQIVLIDYKMSLEAAGITFVLSPPLTSHREKATFLSSS